MFTNLQLKETTIYYTKASVEHASLRGWISGRGAAVLVLLIQGIQHIRTCENVFIPFDGATWHARALIVKYFLKMKYLLSSRVGVGMDIIILKMKFS